MKHFFTLTIFLSSFFTIKSQVADSLFAGARDERNSTQERVRMYDEIGWQTSAFDTDQAILYADTAVQLARAAGDSGLVAFALNGKSIPYLRMGEFKAVERILNRALKADTSDVNLTARIVGKLAKVQQEQGNLDEALKTYIRCYRIFNQQKDSLNKAIACNHIGNIYLQRDKMLEAKSYFEQAVEVHQNQKDTFNLAAAYYSLAQWYEHKPDLDSALLFANRNTQLMQAIKAGSQTASSLINQGTILYKLKRESEALAVFEEALEKAEQGGYETSILFASKNIGEILYEQGNYKKAQPYLERATQLGVEKQVDEKMINTHKYLLEIAIRDGETEKVAHYTEGYERALKKRFDEKEAENLAQVTAKFEDAQQKATIAEQELALQKGETTIAKQRLQNFGLIGALLLLGLMALFLFNRSKNKQKLAMQQAIFSEREKGFAQIVEATEQERDRISKDLHDGMGQQLTVMKLSLNSLANNIGEEHQADLGAVIDSFSKSAEDVRLLSHQMMPRMLMDYGLPQAIQDLLDNSFKHTPIQYEFEHKGMTERLDKNVEVAVYRVVQELINNMIKHAEAKNFSLRFIRSEKKLAGFIADDGKGFNADHLGEGHGLKNMKNRLALINGTMDIESNPGKGTAVSLSIPIV